MMNKLAIGLLCCLGAATCSPRTADVVPAPALVPTVEQATGQTHPITAACSGCHSATDGAMRSLDTLTADQLAATLRHYRDDTSGQSVMHRISRGLSDADITAISKDLGKSDEASS